MKKRFAAIFFAVIFVISSLPIMVSAENTDSKGIKIFSASLTLEDKVNINFDIKLTGIEKSAEYGLILFKTVQSDLGYNLENAEKSATEGNAIIYKNGEWQTDEDGEYCRYIHAVSAKEMADVVYALAYAKVENTTYYSSLVPYSVHIYAARKLGRMGAGSATSSETLKDLLRSLVSYGSFAQIHFNHNTEIKADAFLSDGEHTFEAISIFSENELSVTKIERCKNCGIAQMTTVDKSEGEEEPTGELDIYFFEEEGICHVLGIGTYTGKDIVIPSEYNGSPVVSIGSGAFSGTDITSVFIPATVTTIEFGAFSDCDYLESVTFEDAEENWIWFAGSNEIEVTVPSYNAKYLSLTYSTENWTKSN